MTADQPAGSRYATSVTLPSDVEIVIRRTFDASASRVFAAWTTPDSVSRWWPSPGSAGSQCQIDLRVGGRWRWALLAADGSEQVVFSGRYRVIEAPRRLEYSERCELTPELEYLVAMTFAERAGVTTVETVMTFASQQDRDAQLRSGVEPGIRPAYARVDRMLHADSRSEAGQHSTPRLP